MKFSKNDLETLGCGGVIFVILLAIALLFGLFCFEAWIAMLLWNGVIVALFAAPVVSFWQMAGIIILCNILFKAVSKIWSND